MIHLEIWFDRALGTPFELELNRLPTTIEYERREATTFKRRTATPWLVYVFRHLPTGPDDVVDIIEIANRVEERYKKAVRIYQSAINTGAVPSVSD